MKGMRKLICLFLTLCLLPLTAFAADTADTLPEVESLYVTYGVVHFTTSVPIAACCFTRVEIEPSKDSPDWIEKAGQEFSFFKYDGAYFLWLRDDKGNISAPYALTVDSGYHYYLNAEGLSPLETPAEEVLDIDDANAYIYQRAAEAGLYTREGVLSAGAAVLSYLGERGYSLPYLSGGTYQDEGDWGISPDFGRRLSKPVTDSNGTYYHVGMQCVAAIVWTYKLASINLSNESTVWSIYNVGALSRNGDNQIAYDKAIGGDLVFTGTHTLMIFDRLDKDGDGVDDTYLTYEMWAPHLMLMERNMYSMRYLSFYSMENVFQNQSAYISRAHFWPGTLFIPEDAFPALLQQAVTRSKQSAALHNLLRGFQLEF